jgi:hypothetical protein
LSTGLVKKHSLFYSGPYETAREILRMKGMRGLFYGFWAQLARDSPASAVQMSFYELLSYQGAQMFPLEPNWFVNFMCGGTCRRSLLVVHYAYRCGEKSYPG